MDLEVKILPCYFHLHKTAHEFDIDFLYGGRDSGKSRHIAQQLIIDCISQKYFKCLLIRKVLKTVRDSQYSLIKAVIDEWNVKHLFSFNDTRMEIICRDNGNGFYGRGLDDVGRIKSFNNPSHCWIEEGNQIDVNDFVVILTSLRANQRVKTWFSFNPECEVNYTDFWLYQEYFSHSTALSFTWTKTITTEEGDIDFKVRATHTTYKDNPYCKPQRKALYESYKNSKNNAYWYQTYTLGLWGFRRSGDLYLPCFDEEKHTKEIKELYKSTVHIVADNNVSPYIAVSCMQIDFKEKRISQVHELPAADPDNTATKAARKVIKWLDKINYEETVFVYGDATARKRSTEDDEGRSFFDKFIGTIKEAGYKVVSRVQKSNPEVAISGEFVNEIFESNHLGWTIEIASHCRKSIEDYSMVKKDMEGKILKKTVTNPDTKVSYQQYGHYTDDLRYFITTVLPKEFEAYKKRTKKFFGYAV